MKTEEDERPFPPIDLARMDLSRPARVQICASVLPRLHQESDVTFPWSLADAIRFYMTKPKHEQDGLEILTQPRGGKRGRVLSQAQIYDLYASDRFPRG